MLIAGMSTRFATRRGHEAPTDRRLPMREDPLRDHRGAAGGQYLSLSGLPTSDQQRLLIGDCCPREGIPPDRGLSHVGFNAPPIVGASTPDWFARNAALGCAGCRGMV